MRGGGVCKSEGKRGWLEKKDGKSTVRADSSRAGIGYKIGERWWS